MNKNKLGQQSEKNSNYSGTTLLEQNEEYLRNYNDWLTTEIIKHIPLNCGLKILDFGAGTGTLLKIIQKRTNLVIDAVEIDAQQRDILCNSGVVCFESVDIIENKYDFIYTSNVLEHIEEDVTAIKKLYSLLTPGGILAIYVPALDKLWTGLDDSVGHFRRYNRKELNSKLLESGFKVCILRYCDSIGGILALVFKLITKSKSESLPSNKSLWIYDRMLFSLNKITDLFFNRFFGKNIFAVAKKPLN